MKEGESAQTDMQQRKEAGRLTAIASAPTLKETELRGLGRRPVATASFSVFL